MLYTRFWSASVVSWSQSYQIGGMLLIRVKPDVDIIALLKAAGYSTYRIAQERIFGQSTLTKFRRHGLPSWAELNTLCGICGCSPWDVIEYVPEDAQQRHQEPTSSDTDTD